MTPTSLRAFPVPGGLTLVGDHYGPAEPVAGKGTVLFLHGGGQTRHAWGQAAAKLGQAGFVALTLDMRGHGDSSRAPDGVYIADRFLADLSAVLLQLPDGVALVGASLGGMAGLMHAGEGRSPPLSKLVLVDIAHRSEDDGIDRIVGFMAATRNGFADLDEAAAAVKAYTPQRTRPVRHEGLKKNLRQREDGRWVWHWDPAFLGAFDSEAIKASGRMEKAARALKIPTLLVRGGVSDVVTPEIATEFLALAPGARMADVGGAAHMVAGDENDVFFEALRGFLMETM